MELKEKETNFKSTKEQAEANILAKACDWSGKS